MIKAGFRLFIRYWLPLLGYATVILFLSSRPALGLPPLDLSDKFYHFVEYTLLSALFFRLFFRDLDYTGIQSIVFTVIATALFAAGDELLQSTIPGRQADPWDWLADMGGCLTGILLYAIARFAWDRRNP